jgi:hypothetical protein
LLIFFKRELNCSALSEFLVFMRGWIELFKENSFNRQAVVRRPRPDAQTNANISGFIPSTKFVTKQKASQIKLSPKITKLT